MATQAEITARLEQSIANQKKLQAAIKAAAPVETGAEATVSGGEVEATS